MPSRNQKRRDQRAEYLQKQDDILSQENKAKARARYKADPEKKKASVRDSYKADPEKKEGSVRDSYKVDPEKKEAFVRVSYKADPEKKKASVRDSYNADIESKQSAKRQRYQEDVEENRAAKRQRYQEDVEENRAAKRQRYQEDLEENRAAKRQRYQEDLEENRAAKRQRYQEDVEENRAAKRQTIQLPLRHLKGIGIGMTPLSDWLNVLPRGSGIAGVTELPLPPKVLGTNVYQQPVKLWDLRAGLSACKMCPYGAHPHLAVFWPCPQATVMCVKWKLADKHAARDHLIRQACCQGSPDQTSMLPGIT
ncbi:hypothetical protein EMCRGX_G008525 [Ephydatia muelleri]